MQKKQWEAPQWNDEPMESYIVDGPDNIDMFRRFEKMYEKYLNPGGTVFLVVDDINVPKLYKLFLSSSRARGRTMRRYVDNLSKELPLHTFFVSLKESFLVLTPFAKSISRTDIRYLLLCYSQNCVGGTCRTQKKRLLQ